MPSATVNVVRYSALLSGVVYGWYHHRTLQAAHDKHKIDHAVHEREKLVAQAKEAWNRKQEALRHSGSAIVTNPEDPRFDLEVFINSLEKAS